jgi:predicted DNA-binding transcriptional regulator AlpA
LKSTINFDQLPDAALINTKTVAELFGGLSRSTIWRWMKDGRLPEPIRITPGKPLWSVGALRAFLANKSNFSN